MYNALTLFLLFLLFLFFLLLICGFRFFLLLGGFVFLDFVVFFALRNVQNVSNYEFRQKRQLHSPKVLQNCSERHRLAQNGSEQFPDSFVFSPNGSELPTVSFFGPNAQMVQNRKIIKKIDLLKK